ncbi:putative LOC102086281 [Columba livia]|uniref:Putative LOC102086281 n=1 Tax=Columba livia TaxID=8932 RepID=A0A2I0LXQ4_COLLI|nr:putative LOC102086281 [Columba livia]
MHPCGSQKLSIMYASGKTISLVQVGPGAHSKQLQEWQGAHLQDVDWQRSVIYGTDDRGTLLRVVGHPGRREAIMTGLPVCSARVDIGSGDLYWLACNRRDIGVIQASDMSPHILHRARSSIQHIFLDWQRGSQDWLARGQPLQQLSLAGGAPRRAGSGGLRGLRAAGCATKEGACPATPSTCDHHYKDNNKHHCCSAHHLHHKTYTKQDHHFTHYYSCTNQQVYHNTNQDYPVHINQDHPVHINQDHPCTNHCPDHTNQEHHCATSHHSQHHHSVLASQDHCSTADYYHPAPKQPCTGSATYPTPPIWPCTPPDTRPPSVLSTHACALP